MSALWAGSDLIDGSGIEARVVARVFKIRIQEAVLTRHSTSIVTKEVWTAALTGQPREGMLRTRKGARARVEALLAKGAGVPS